MCVCVSVSVYVCVWVCVCKIYKMGVVISSKIIETTSVVVCTLEYLAFESANDSSGTSQY